MLIKFITLYAPLSIGAYTFKAMAIDSVGNLVSSRAEATAGLLHCANVGGLCVMMTY